MSATTPDIQALERRVEELQGERQRALDVAEDVLIRLSATKAELSAGASAGRSKGQYVEPGRWDTLQRRMVTLPAEHQKALREVSRIKREIASVSEQINDLKQSQLKQGASSFAEHFMDVAREMLDVDVFSTLMREASLHKNRDLVRYEGNRSSGAAMGVHAGGGGIRKRSGE